MPDWRNPATRIVADYIWDENEGLYEKLFERAKRLAEGAFRREACVERLAEEVREAIEAIAVTPGVDAGGVKAFMADLIGDALKTVDWSAIAEDLLEAHE